MLSSPTFMNDLPQTFMEPLLFSTACKRGTQGRMSTEYLSHVQDADGVTTTLRDRLSGREFGVRSKYLVGDDGGYSLVDEQIDAAIEGRLTATELARLLRHARRSSPAQLARLMTRAAQSGHPKLAIEARMWAVSAWASCG